MADTNTRSNPTSTRQWTQLAEQAEQAKHRTLRNYFDDDPQRTTNFLFDAAGLRADLSRQHLSADSLHTLLELAHQQQLAEQIHKLFAAKAINHTEQRPAMHMALRGGFGTEDMRKEVDQCLQQMQQICERLQHGFWRGYSDKAIADVVNLGIGGSDLGPHMATTALAPYHNDQLNIHYVSNVDPNDLENTLATLNPETTLFIVASKSWSTAETLSNADTARRWLLQQAGNPSTDISQHFIAITSRADRCVEYGFSEDNILPMWDWVGGRYSLWSAVGLSIALATSFDCFQELLAGAHEMDRHFAHTPLEENLPVLLALMEIWYTNFWQCQSHAVLPYSFSLRLLPDHLQQLVMESNGKSTDNNGNPVNYQTCPVIWGAAGTNGQHSFHQLLHQGTLMIPVDFILPIASHSENQYQQRQLIANCLAQAEALMDGQSLETLREMHPDIADELLTHRAITGNKPSTLITMEKLTPQTLGALIALYEHKVFAASAIWNINAFDQWGVELGKTISTSVNNILASKNNSAINPATKASIDRILEQNESET